MKRKIVLVFVICMGMAATACSGKSSSDKGTNVQTIKPVENREETSNADENTTDTNVTEQEENNTEGEQKQEDIPASPEEEYSDEISAEESQIGESVEGPSIPKKVNESGYSGKDESEYIGEYKNSDTDSAGLEIAKADDGKYIVQISIDGLATFDDGVGELTEIGMNFIASDPEGSPIGGVITLEGNTATVKFTGSSWDNIAEDTAFVYEKTSDTANIWSE